MMGLTNMAIADQVIERFLGGDPIAGVQALQTQKTIGSSLYCWIE